MRTVAMILSLGAAICATCAISPLRADDLNLGPLNVADGQIVLAAQPRNVDTVWIDGIVRKRNGELVDFDVPAAMQAAQVAVAGLSERIGKPVV